MTPRRGFAQERREHRAAPSQYVSIPRLVEHAGLDDVRIDEVGPSGALST